LIIIIITDNSKKFLMNTEVKLFMFDENVHNILKRKNRRFAICLSIFVLVLAAGRMVVTRFYMHPKGHFYLTANIFVLSLDYIIAACIFVIYLI